MHVRLIVIAPKCWTVFTSTAWGDSRSIVGLRWWDKVPDSEVLKQAEVASISTTIMTAQLRWLRYEKAQESLPKRTAYGKSAKRGGWCKHCYLQLLPKRFHVELHDSFRTALLDLAGLCRGHLLNHTNISVTSGICSCSGTNRRKAPGLISNSRVHKNKLETESVMYKLYL